MGLTTSWLSLIARIKIWIEFQMGINRMILWNACYYADKTSKLGMTNFEDAYKKMKLRSMSGNLG